MSITSLSVFAQDSEIPDWVKNTAGWWADNTLSDQEYLDSIQYLINQDIIEIPVKHAVAVDSNLSDDQRVASVIVHYGGGDFQTPKTIYTYSEFQHLSSTVRTGNTNLFIDIPTTPTFYLSGLPSMDKKPVYQIVDEFVDPRQPPSLYTVTVDLVTAKGDIIQAWNYRQCGVLDYFIYLDSSKTSYRFSSSDEAEHREIIVWECAGYSLDV